MTKAISADGTEIAFDRQGDGPPVVLVAGAFSHRVFDPRTRELARLLAADGHEVVNYDRRGRGESGDTAPYAVEREIEDLDAVLAEMGGPACVVGMSSGACLALEAARTGLAIDRLAVWEAPLIVDDSRPPIPADYRDRLADLVAADRRGDAVELFLTVAANAPVDTVAQLREAPNWPGFEAVAHTALYDEALLGDHTVSRARLAEITAPTLVGDGGASPAWLRTTAAALADALPNAQHRTLDGQTHAVAPDALAPVLAEFFA